MSVFLYEFPRYFQCVQRFFIYSRQKLFATNILSSMKELLSDRHPDILKEVLSVCRALILDDDVRVEFGKAHEHARIIATEMLCPLIGLINSKYLDFYTWFFSDELFRS